MHKFRVTVLMATLVFLVSCKKDRSESISGQILYKGGCGTNTWLVVLDNPDPSRYSFLCKDGLLSSASYNCSNSVFLDIPIALQTANQKIRFSGITGISPSCLSSTFAPNHLEVKKVEPN